MTMLNTSSLTSKDGIVSSCCLQVLAHLQRHLMAYKKDLQNPAQTLKLDITKLIDLFEKQVTGEPLVSIMICGILSDCLSFVNQTSIVIYGRFANQQTFTLLQQLLDVNKAKSDLKKVDGTNYGCPYAGYYDNPFALLQKLLVRHFGY